MSIIFFGDTELPWIAPLCNEVSKKCPISKINFKIGYNDNGFFLLKTVHDKVGSIDSHLWKVLPGFNSILSFIYLPVIRYRLMRIISKLNRADNISTYIVISDPRLTKYVSSLKDCKIIYWMYDMYDGDSKLFKVESKLKNISYKIFCSSFELSKKIKQERELDEEKIIYFPHGSNVAFLNRSFEHTSDKRFVIVNGYLTARYDWDLIYNVTKGLPSIEFVFVGNIINSSFNKDEKIWYRLLTKVLDLPNVKHISELPHSSTIKYYWDSFVVWLPYDINIPFNFYSCPMKIMDGLCSGRPVISTGLSESLIHKDFIQIANNPEETIYIFENIFTNTSLLDLEFLYKRQLAYAKHNSWAERAESLISKIV